MPWTDKQMSFFGLCASPKGRKKARKKCPPVAEAKRMLRHGVKPRFKQGEGPHYV